MGKRTLPASRRKSRELIRVAVYLRVSTEEQVKGFGLKAQKSLCIKWLDFKFGKGNYVIVGFFSDDGVSGKLNSRPRYDDLNRIRDTNGCDIIVCGKLDRMGRTMKEINRWVYDTTDQGIRFATADGRIDSEDDLFGIVLSLLAYMAELEHTLIMERTAQGREQKILAGGWPLGQPPFGVKLEGTGKNAVPVLSEQECRIWEEVYRCRVLEEMNWAETAIELNVLELLTSSGKEWTGDNLRNRIVKSTAIDGYAEFRISCDVDDADDEDAEAFKVFRIPVPKPLSDEKAAALKQVMQDQARSKAASGAYLLSGRILGTCGAHYTGSVRPDSEVTDAVYKCSGRRQGIKECTCSEIPLSEIESVVWREIESVISDRSRFHAIVSDWLGSTPERIASYERRIAQLDERLEAMGDTKKSRMLSLLEKLAETGDEDIDLETLEGLKADLKVQNKEDVKKAREEKAQVQEWLDDARSQIERVDGILRAIDALNFSVESATVEQKRELVKLLDIKVQIKGKGISRRTGVADPLTEWHRRTGRLVPVAITDEQWSSVEQILKPSRQQADAARETFEAILRKLRTAARWQEVPLAGAAWSTVYRRARAWQADGSWEAAMNVLGAHGGVPVPDLYVMPPFEISGGVDPRYTDAQRLASDGQMCEGCAVGAHEDCNESRMLEHSARRSSSSG